SANLITKIYFPRLIIPLAAVGAGLVDLALSFLVLVGMMFHYGTPLSWGLLMVPALLLGTLLVATGVGMLLSALMVAYRDFRYGVPFLVQIWMFASPVMYPSKIVPEKWRLILFLNPMAGLIDGFRAAFLGQPFHWNSIGISLVISVALFFAGAAYFRRVEKR